jgi:hypothetical protein
LLIRILPLLCMSSYLPPFFLPCRYDNEWGYSARLVEVAGMVAKSL